MKRPYRSIAGYLLLVPAIAIAFGAGYTISQITRSDNAAIRKIGVALEDKNKNNEMEQIRICFDKDGDDRFDTVTMYQMHQPPLSKPYNGECDRQVQIR